MKKHLIMVIMFLIFCYTPTAAAAQGYNLEVELKKQVLSFPDQRPFIDSFGWRSFLPLRIVADALGLDVQWDTKTNSAIVKRNNQEVKMEVGAKTVVVKGIETELNGRAEIVNDRLMVPSDFFSKGLDYDMYWDYGTRLVIIFEK